MPLDHYVTLGRSGLRVSPFCLGAMTFGEEWGFGSDEKEAAEVLSRYLEKGGNFIDTANVYTKGHSEKIIGDHLGRSPAKRWRAVIATKFFGTMRVGDPNAGGAGRKAIMQACEDSLRRLQTDYIDLYWMHCYDKFTPVEETMRALDDLVSAGKIRYAGFSDTPAWKVSEAQTLALFRGWAPLAALQIEYSLLERTVEGELMPMARHFGLGVTPWSPLKYGILTGKFTRANRKKAAQSKRGDWVTGNLNDHAYAVVDLLVKTAKQARATPAQVALAWVQRQPGVTSTIIGARTVAQLDDNLKGLDIVLKKDHLAALSELTKPTLDFPAAFVERAGNFSSGGATINGERFEPTPMAPKDDSDRY